MQLLTFTENLFSVFSLTICFKKIKNVSIPSVSGGGVEGCPLDHGLPAVCPVQAVGGGRASRPGDGRRTPTVS